MTGKSNNTVLLLGGHLVPRGSSAYSLRLAERLPQQDFNAHLICQSCHEVPEERRDKISLLAFPYIDFSIWRSLLSKPMLQQFKSMNPTLVHVQTRNMLSVGSWLARTLKIPLVLTIHDFLDTEEFLDFRPKYGGKVISVSHAVKADLLKHSHLDDEDVEVIYSGVEVDAQADDPAKRTTHVPVVGTASPLEPLKGQSHFIYAAEKVIGRGLDVEFLIAGRGPEERNLRRIANRLNLTPHITFVPYLSAYTEALQAMDIFCLPSLQQGLGTVMFEAMALGKPVIATNVGGVANAITDGETGLIIPPKDPDILAEKIIGLLEDPLYAQELGENGKRLIVDRFNVDRMVEDTAKVYESLMPVAATT